MIYISSRGTCHIVIGPHILESNYIQLQDYKQWLAMVIGICCYLPMLWNIHFAVYNIELTVFSFTKGRSTYCLKLVMHAYLLIGLYGIDSTSGYNGERLEYKVS